MATFSFFDRVTIVGGQDGWGHAPRNEIVGKSAVILGICKSEIQPGKCYVFVEELGRTYGIHPRNLRPLGDSAPMLALLPAFSEHYFGLFSYGLIYPCSVEEFGHHRDVLARNEADYPWELVIRFPRYAIEHLPELREKCYFDLQNSDRLVTEYLELYDKVLGGS